MISYDDIEAMADEEFLKYWNEVSSSTMFLPEGMEELMEKFLLENYKTFSYNESWEEFVKYCFKKAYFEKNKV